MIWNRRTQLHQTSIAVIKDQVDILGKPQPEDTPDPSAGQVEYVCIDNKETVGVENKEVV